MEITAALSLVHSRALGSVECLLHMLQFSRGGEQGAKMEVLCISLLLIERSNNYRFRIYFKH